MIHTDGRPTIADPRNKPLVRPDKPLPQGRRCYCGHFREEHTASGGCGGCDASGQSPEGLCLHGRYECDPNGEPQLDT